jgi:flagellar M-ring protein FliF
VRYEQRPMGGIKRLSVGVVVNYRRIVDAKTGKVTVRPLAAAEVAQINELVRQAMGYSKERGDTLNVTNAPFDGVDKPADPIAEIPFWKDPENLPLGVRLLKYLVAAIVLAFLWFRVLRPMLRPVFRKIDHINDDAESADAREEAEEEKARLAVEEALATTEPPPEAPGQQGYRENLALAKTLAQNDPRVVANVVKAWVGAE